MQTVRCDVCILGGGAAGLFLAERLTQDGSMRVVLVEAGPRDFAARVEPYTARSAPRAHRGINEARITAFGGATNTWGGGLMRLAPQDLAQLPGLPDTAWPLAYDELAHQYPEVEQELGVASRGYPEGEAYRANGLFFRRRLVTILPFRRKNFARTFGRIVLARRNFSALFDAGRLGAVHATSRKIDALDVLTAADGTRRIEARDFVIAAGVVNTNFLVRKILSAVDLDHDCMPLGAFFHDHLSIPLFSVKPDNAGSFSRRFSYRFAGSLMYAEHYESERPAESVSSIPGGFLHFTFDMAASPALRVAKQWLERVQRGESAMPGLRESLHAAAQAARIGAVWLTQRTLYLPPNVPVTVVLDLEQVPDAAWRFNWRGDEPDPACLLHWDIGEADVRAACRYAAAARGLIAELRREAPFSSEELFPDPESEAQEFERYVRRTAWDAFHAGGGLRMGLDPARSIVTPSLATHAIPNVHVLGTAVFPRGGSANPTLTVLALARRLADALRAPRSG